MADKNYRKNKRTGLLEVREHDYTLENLAEPELFRGIFDYHSVPKIVFNDRIVPHNTPEKLFITDTTFRDGQQSMSPFTVKQIVDLFRLMSRLGGEKGLVRQSEFFVYSKKDQEAVRACQELGLKFPEITTWIRANEKDFDLVKSMNVEETGILVSCSD